MSRFSRAEAEAAGWVFTHSRGDYEVVTSATQGELRHTPATIVAEKYVSLPGKAATLIHEEAESEGKLLERIHAYEMHLQGVIESQKPTNVEIGQIGSVPLDNEGDPIRTVHGPGGISMTEAEWAARDRTDIHLVKGDDPDAGHEQAIAGPTEAVQDIVAAKAEVKEIKETLRTNMPEVPAKQIELDPADVGLDAPGATGTGTLIVHEDAENAAEALQRKSDISREKEEQRVAGGLPFPEETAGVGASLAAHSDLASDQPRIMDIPPDNPAPVSGGPTEMAQREERLSFEAGVGGEVAKTREEEGLAEVHTEDAYADQVEAGLSSVDEQREDAEVPAADEPEPDVAEPVVVMDEHEDEIVPEGADVFPGQPVGEFHVDSPEEAGEADEQLEERPDTGLEAVASGEVEPEEPVIEASEPETPASPVSVTEPDTGESTEVDVSGDAAPAEENPDERLQQETQPADSNFEGPAEPASE